MPSGIKDEYFEGTIGEVIAAPPRPVAEASCPWVNARMMLSKKPGLWHRFWLRLLLGVTVKDLKNQ